MNIIRLNGTLQILRMILFNLQNYNFIYKLIVNSLSIKKKTKD